MKHTVIGTAGHIDHGKTMLLKALTGIDADRLPEEKARGMTIDLGFVFMGRDVTIIDVPGHEKFIRNMLAGVNTIDMVIFVIAADDGIMPQTKEHFEILKLLDIKNGIIALTKIDIVEKDWLELVKTEIREFTKGTFLEYSPILPVSSVTGEGIPEFKEVLYKAITNTKPKQDKGIFRLWVDRAFLLKGIGTVITGTVLSGILKSGDKLELLPQGKVIRARNIQVHNENVQQCFVGERAAINVIGAEVSEISRGNVISSPGHFQPTYMVNAKLYLIKDAVKSLKNRTRIRFHVGTAELLARVVLLDRKILNPGDSSIVQFRIEGPLSVNIGDKYVIRSYSPQYTIGGGTIVEVHAKKLKYLPDKELTKFEKLEKADIKQLIIHLFERSPLKLKTIESISTEVSLTEKAIKTAIEKLIEKKVVIYISGKNGYLLTEQVNNAKIKTIDFLKIFHKQFTYLNGLKQSELKAKLFEKIDIAVFDVILNSLVNENKVKIKQETISLSEHKITFTKKQEKIKQIIEKLYLEKKYITPSVEEIIAQLTDTKQNEIMNVIRGMIEYGILIEVKTSIGKPVLFHSENVKKAEKLLIDILKKKGELRLFEFRELINSTRKYTTPLLTYFDSKNITERDGDVRRLKE